MSEDSLKGEVVARVPLVQFETFAVSFLTELANEEFAHEILMKDIAFTLEEEPDQGTVQVKAEHPLSANGHSHTESYSIPYFTSNTWKIFKRLSEGRELGKSKFWINPKLGEKKAKDREIDVTRDYY